MTPDPTNTRQLIANCQGLVRSLAWRIHQGLPKSVDLDDLIGYAQIGLAEAARDYDPQRKVQFTTFAYYRIRGAIFDGLSKMNWFKKADFHSGRYERMANAVLDAESRDDNSTEVEDDVRWFKGMTGALAVVHLFCQSSSDEGTPQDAALEDHGAESPVEVTVQNEVVSKLRELVDELPEDGRTLIRATYFEGLSLKEAGERLGVSKSWASRLHAKTLGQLAHSLRVAQVAD